MPGDDGRFTPVMAMVNKKQVSIADGTVFPEQYADESRLRYGVFDPAAGGDFRVEDIKPYLWPKWDEPSYRTRLKQSYSKVAEVYGSIK